MVKVLAISLHSRNSTFAPSGWFMHAWSQIIVFLYIAARELSRVPAIQGLNSYAGTLPCPI